MAVASGSRHRFGGSLHRFAPCDAPQWSIVDEPRARIVIIGGGPGGYEAALVAAQLGAQVTVVDRDGLGGACVLTDCVPSKTLIATSGMMAGLDGSAALGIRYGSGGTAAATVDAPRLYSRVLGLARAQSGDVAGRLAAEGVEVRSGAGRLVGPRTVAVGDTEVSADIVLVRRERGPACCPMRYLTESAS
jgi:pyruvate/2-oxoglutarate dehydrogenase complex dihydrolipoamide dehydrogenase (E3) component